MAGDTANSRACSALETTRKDLSLLHKALDQMEALELPEPDDEAMALARKHFDNGYRLMSGL
jgi:hypothetical protein